MLIAPRPEKAKASRDEDKDLKAELDDFLADGGEEAATPALHRMPQAKVARQAAIAGEGGV